MRAANIGLVARQMDMCYSKAYGKLTDCADWLGLVVPINGSISFFEKYNIRL